MMNPRATHGQVAVFVIAASTMGIKIADVRTLARMTLIVLSAGDSV
jgi:hypothetical protein